MAPEDAEDQRTEQAKDNGNGSFSNAGEPSDQTAKRGCMTTAEKRTEKTRALLLDLTTFSGHAPRNIIEKAGILIGNSARELLRSLI